jgi:hypothetical protein
MEERTEAGNAGARPARPIALPPLRSVGERRNVGLAGAARNRFATAVHRAPPGSGTSERHRRCLSGSNDPWPSSLAPLPFVHAHTEVDREIALR